MRVYGVCCESIVMNQNGIDANGAKLDGDNGEGREGKEETVWREWKGREGGEMEREGKDETMGMEGSDETLQHRWKVSE